MRDRSFMVATPALRKCLPLSTRSLKTTDSFKCAMKTFLFREAYAVQFNLINIFLRSYSYILESIHILYFCKYCNSYIVIF